MEKNRELQEDCPKGCTGLTYLHDDHETKSCCDCNHQWNRVDEVVSPIQEPVESKAGEVEQAVDLCVCGSSDINKSFIESGKWLGSSTSGMRRYSLTDERFNTREYSLGFDFYASKDLLRTCCGQCGKVDYVTA